MEKFYEFDRQLVDGGIVEARISYNDEPPPLPVNKFSEVFNHHTPHEIARGCSSCRILPSHLFSKITGWHDIGSVPIADEKLAQPGDGSARGSHVFRFYNNLDRDLYLALFKPFFSRRYKIVQRRDPYKTTLNIGMCFADMFDDRVLANMQNVFRELGKYERETLTFQSDPILVIQMNWPDKPKRVSLVDSDVALTSVVVKANLVTDVNKISETEKLILRLDVQAHAQSIQKFVIPFPLMKLSTEQCKWFLTGFVYANYGSSAAFYDTEDSFFDFTDSRFGCDVELQTRVQKFINRCMTDQCMLPRSAFELDDKRALLADIRLYMKEHSIV